MTTFETVEYAKQSPPMLTFSNEIQPYVHKTLVLSHYKCRRYLDFNDICRVLLHIKQVSSLGDQR